MQARFFLNRLAVGLTLMSVGGLTAWSVGRDLPSAESSPMETVLSGTAGSGGVSWDIPVTRNERVDNWIDFLSDANSDKTRLWLERSGRYAPMIQAELRRRGMPEDLLYLALIESGFSPRARSSAAAVGIWQFMSATGRNYGLTVNGELDERRDPIKATSAALDYLQDLYDQFGSWYLAAAAYNSGENRVERVLRERAGGARGNDSLFWRIAPHLPQETRNYVPLMLAAGHIAKEPEKYGFKNLHYHEPLDYEVAWVPGATDLGLIARATGVERTVLDDLNPQLTSGRTPKGRGWAVRMPSGSRVAFVRNFPGLYRSYRLAQAEESKRPSVVAASMARTHRVKRGETLNAIARRYGVSLGSLRAANGGVSPRSLQIGQRLKVPGKSATKVATTRTTRVHTVRRGENLSVIAQKYGTSVRRLQSLNDLGRRSRIQPGQHLRVRA